MDGRFCRTMPPPPARTANFDPGTTKILARRLPAHPRCLLDATQRPTKTAQRNDLFPLFSAQDVAHDHKGYLPLQWLCLKPSPYV
jgi:hypothetical protein